TLAGKICHRNTERRCAGEQCACRLRKYWKADCTAAGGRTGRGYRISACVNTRDGRPAPPLCYAASSGGKASIAAIVRPEPIHPELATRGALDLKKADLEHDLLRRSHAHCVHDSAAFGYQALGHLNGALGGHRIAGDATEHDLAVTAANADTTAAGARTDLFLEIAGVQGDLHVNHADQLLARIEYRDLGGPNLLALNVQRAIRHRQRVYDIWRPHHSAGERLFDPQGTRLINRDDDVPYGTTLFVLRLRLGVLQRPRCDPKQSRSDDQWHEK